MRALKNDFFSFLVLTSVFLLAYLFEWLSRDYVFAKSIELILYFQKEYNQVWLQSTLQLVSFSIHTITTSVGIITVFYLSTTKMKTLNFIIFLFLQLYICIQIKDIFGNPRPYWVNNQIKITDKYIDYGNPSAHSWIGVLFYILLYKEFIEDPDNLAFSNKRVRFFCRLMLVGAIGVLAFSRLYMGMHSLNQIVFGIIFASYSLYIYHYFFLSDSIDKMLVALSTRNSRQIFRHNKKLIQAHLLLIVIPVFIYYIINTSRIHPPEWMNNIKATLPEFKEFDTYHHICLLSSSVVSLVFGMLYGLNNNLFKRLTKVDGKKFRKIFENRQELGIVAHVARIIFLFVGSIGLLVVPLLLIKTTTIYAKYLVGNLAFTVSGLFMTNTNYFYYRTSSLDESDLFYVDLEDQYRSGSIHEEDMQKLI